MKKYQDAMSEFLIKEKNEFFKKSGSDLRVKARKDANGDYTIVINITEITPNFPAALKKRREYNQLIEKFFEERNNG